MKVFQQATTGVLHSRRSCSITSRTRYDHFEIDTETTAYSAEDLAKFPRCTKCWPTTSAATQTTTTPKEATLMAARKTDTTKTPATDEAVIAEVGGAIAETFLGKKAPAKKTTSKAKVATKPEKAPEVEAPDLTKPLLAGLAAEGIEARAAISPKGNFYRVEIDEKTTIAFVNYRAKGALRIEPRIEKLPAKLRKVFVEQPRPRQGLFFVATFETETSLPAAVEALKLAAESARAGKEA